MFDTEELKALEQQQTLLVAEADLRRRAAVAEAAALRQRLAAPRALAEGIAGRSVLVALATALGFFAWRKAGTRFKWLPLLVSAWKFARRFSNW